MADLQDALIASSSTLSKVDDSTKVRELTGIVDQLRADFKARDLQHDLIDDILFCASTPQIPEAYAKTALVVRARLAIKIATMVTAALSVNPPEVSFQPIGFGTSYEENSSLREHFFDASWTRQQEEAKDRLFRKFMYSLVTKGSGVLKTVERQKTAWSSYGKYSRGLKGELDSPDGPYQGLDNAGKDSVYHAKTEEYKRGQPYPIRTSYVPANTFYFKKSEDGITFAAEVKQVDYLENLDKFGYGLDGRGHVVPQGMGMALPSSQWAGVMGKTTTLSMYEAWTWDTVYYVLIGPGQSASQGSKLGSGTLVKKIKHKYGDSLCKTLRGPYFHAYGTSTDSALPDRAGLSILYPYLDLFPLLDSLLTIRANAAYFTGFPSFKRVKSGMATQLPPSPYGSDGADKDGALTTITPGTIYPDDVEPIQMPSSGSDFNSFLSEVHQMIQDALPESVQGAGPATSGYDTNQKAYLASLAWDPIVDNAQIALSERVGFESWLIENRIKESVTVWGEVPPDQKRGSKDGWLSIDGDVTRGVHRYQIRLNPQTPSNRIIDIRTHEEMLRLRLESRADAISELGGNPDEVELAWLIDDLKQDPSIKSAMRDRAFKKLATIDQAAMGGQPAVAAIASPGQPAPPDSQTPNVYAPGQNMPLTPTPQGSVAGAPSGAQSPPQNAQPLPGQGG